jgi:hypothetical protein
MKHRDDKLTEHGYSRVGFGPVALHFVQLKIVHALKRTVSRKLK